MRSLRLTAYQACRSTRFTGLGSRLRAVTSSSHATRAESASAIFITWKVCAHFEGMLPFET